MIELRLLSADDWQLWRGLRLQALTDAPQAFASRLADWRGDGDREERWRRRLSIPGSHDVVALLDAAPVGMVSGVPGDEPGVVELISMWVAAAARGRGVGDALVSDVVRWAADVGAQSVRLEVAQGNQAARRLYERHGFRLGQRGEPVPGGTRHELVMERPLTR